MKIKTQDLNKTALNWVVAKAHGENPVIENGVVYSLKTIAHRDYKLVWEPSTNWSQGGPVIEREIIGLDWNGIQWEARDYDSQQIMGAGHTPLVAAMRCYVASKLGDEVNVPDEVAA